MDDDELAAAVAEIAERRAAEAAAGPRRVTSRAGFGRLPVVRRREPRRVVGILSRSDLLAAHAPRLEAARTSRRVRTLRSTLRL